MRRSFTTLAVAALLIGLVATPALADEPVEHLDSESFEATNPCSGKLITINIDSYTSIHEHDGTLFVRVRNTGWTSDGYVMGHGGETAVGTEGNFSSSLNDPWVNPDLGTKFIAQGRFLVVDDKVVIDEFRLECRS